MRKIKFTNTYKSNIFILRINIELKKDLYLTFKNTNTNFSKFLLNFIGYSQILEVLNYRGYTV